MFTNPAKTEENMRFVSILTCKIKFHTYENQNQKTVICKHTSEFPFTYSLVKQLIVTKVEDTQT